MIKRRKTRQIRVGGVRIGRGAPVSIQSMTKVETVDVGRTVAQIKRLEDAGCEIVRIAVKTPADTDAIRVIRKRIKIPLVADIHFYYRLALRAIAAGADKIRLNPGNIRKEEEVAAVIKAAKKAGIPIRIGVNSGSVVTRLPCHHVTRLQDRTSALVNAALRYVKLFEKHDFRDIIISLKSSDVVSTVEAYEAMSERCDYPLHLGVTAAGPYDAGIVKSSIGIGALLLKGIGDTIRVSLTADPVEEVVAAKRILSAIGARRFGPDLISCPTCGRCQVDLAGIVRELAQKLSSVNRQLPTKPLTIAVMGCEVNGPGEAREADIGVAFGRDSGMLFERGKILRKIPASKAVGELVKLITTYEVD
ncbi:MAG: flavodoxin-dependent (E)-4-hydroxy-3-methylbut-2-enyl-diphosphate synthase [Candidatus Omnitrophica bacterium]|nr:flavodoxin-dependent (E)-4-hydroxy-3-methylbut-2-enyl-diphosphate synthase [Candidatus Omnitrophota bacterium]